jgi:two-component system, OmpR family, sensor histidine kinase AdeS
MKPVTGLRRQIIQSLALMTMGIIFLSVFGSYIFYAVAIAYLPGSISETWMPSRVEIIWIVCTIIAALVMALFVAIRLSRRILTPLNSVAESLREIAQGNLDARALMGRHAMGETAQLVSDFNAMAERLQYMTRERQFWNAAIAHELRTPVTILRGRLQGLAEGVFSPDSDIFLGLLRQIEGLARLIEDLRVLSLNDSGHLELHQTEVKLAEEIRAVIDSFATTLDAKGFTLNQELDTRLQTCCDAVRIRQALLALLENACQHANPGTLTVRLSHSETTCYLSVTDEGPGITDEAANDVFTAFHRIEPSRSRQSGGSGLGLAVVRAITEAHGGHAVCQPSGHGGTTFVLCWPITDSPGSIDKTNLS